MHAHVATSRQQQCGANAKEDLTPRGIFHCVYLFLVSYLLCPVLAGRLLFILQF